MDFFLNDKQCKLWFSLPLPLHYKKVYPCARQAHWRLFILSRRQCPCRHIIKMWKQNIKKGKVMRIYDYYCFLYIITHSVNINKQKCMMTVMPSPWWGWRIKTMKRSMKRKPYFEVKLYRYTYFLVLNVYYITYIHTAKHTLLHSFIRRVIKSPGGMGFKRRLGGLHASLVIIITSFDKNIVPTTSLKATCSQYLHDLFMFQI